MQSPVIVNASENLKIDVFQHQFFLGDRFRQCFTYMTRGLQSSAGNKHQQEMCLSLLLEDGGDEANGMSPENFPKVPIRIFQLLENHIRRGQHFTIGDATRLGKSGFFGFSAVYYMPAVQFENLPDCRNVLALILVHQTEHEFARKYGHTRLLSRIGKYCSSFPYPTWNTQRRPALFETGYSEATVLAGAPRADIPDLTADLMGSRVRVNIPAGTAISQVIELLRSDGTVAIFAELSENANACLYWVPGTQPGAYTATGEPTCIGGAFVLFESGDRTAGHLLEDGFTFTFDQQTLESFCDRLANGQDFVMVLAHTENLELEVHRSSGSVRPVFAYCAKAAWHPIMLNQAPGGANVHCSSIEDLSDNPATQFTQADLDHYIHAVESFLSTSMAQEAASLILTIRSIVSRDEFRHEISANVELNQDFIAYICDGLQQLAPFPVTSHAIVDLKFDINHT